MRFRNGFRFAREVWQGFTGRNGFLLAAAVSFYTFLSLFPLLLVAVGILGYILRSPEHAEAILTHFLGRVVIGTVAIDIVTSVLQGREAATGIGIVLLLWAGMAAALMLEQAVNLVWDSPLRQGYFKRRAVALLVLILVGALITVSFGITALVHIVRQLSPSYVSSLSVVWKLLGHLVAALASVGLFTMVYKILPTTRAPLRVALAGGLFSGILWEIAKQIFTFYVVHFAAYSRVYGPLAGVMLLLIWINYSSVIAILGAGFASHCHAKYRDNQRLTDNSKPK
ncbi:MAG: YihY/virulence factor BrkB family protein [Armatimonadetes bacterium]|jgi:membrane protein|nr:YihY/virulence factor BrkB family protein [Armatimonadota bacterium]